MRKEVIYSLAALSLAPVAANAAEGTVIPNFITGDNWTGDIDKDANGVVQWVKQNVTFTVNQRLVPGNYTFTAKLKNPGAAVIFTINGTQKTCKATVDPTTGNTPDGMTLDANGFQSVAVEFTLTEEVQSLVIDAKGITDFNEGENKDYYITFDKNENGLTQGLSFDQSNFKDATTGKWKQPLAGINTAIDNYVNKTLTYQSDEAKRVMTAEKEKIQKETTNDKLTYKFYMDNQLYDPTVETNPLYKEATQVYNEATRIEAQYQADKIKEQVQEFLDNNTAKDADGNLVGDPDPVAQTMANKVLNQITAYETAADGKTKKKNEDGSFTFKDTPATFDTTFDVDPTVSPLKDIKADADDLTLAGGKANALVKDLQVSYKAITDRDADLTDMFGPNDDAENDAKPTVAKTDATKAGKYLAAAKKITAYYKARIDELKADIMGENIKIKDLTAAFVSEMEGKLATMNNQVAEDAPYLASYYTLYGNYKTALQAAKALANQKEELTQMAKRRFGKDAKYTEMSAKFDELVATAVSSIGLPADDQLAAPQNGIDLKKKDGSDNKGVKNIEVLSSTAVTDAASTAGVAPFFADFNAYVKGLNALELAYEEFETQNAAIDAKYEECPNTTNYDNRTYYKQVFNNYFWESKTENGNTTYTAKTFVNKPGTASGEQKQDNSEYTFKTFLDKLKTQLDGAWGSFNAQGVYSGKVATYVTTDAEYLLKTLKEFNEALAYTANLDQDPKGYEECGKYLAVLYAGIDAKLAAYKDKVAQLKQKVQGLALYSANPAIYNPENQKYYKSTDTNTPTFGYAQGGKTYKQLIVEYDAVIKGYDDALAAAMQKYDNTKTQDHTNALWTIWNVDNKLVDAALDDILKDIDEFVRDGGVIDQQIAIYAEKVPLDNYQQLIEYIGNDTKGVLKLLKDRLDADKLHGWQGGIAQADFKDGDYIVGYDKDLDGKLEWDENVGMADLGALTSYDLKPLTAVNMEYINELYNAYLIKFNEAKALYEANNNLPTNRPKQEYEAANGKLGEAIAIINELNDKLQNELEPAIIEEAQAQLTFKQIVDVIKAPAGITDGSEAPYQAGLISYADPHGYCKWWNGSKGATKKVINPNAWYYEWRFIYADGNYDLVGKELGNGGADGDAEDIAKKKEGMNANDLAKYEELAGIHADIMALYASLDEAYRTRDFSAWNLKITPAQQGQTNAKAEINNATLNQIEKDIKAFVNGCVQEVTAIQENIETLYKLITLSNYDGDANDNFDWIDLIKGVDQNFAESWIADWLGDKYTHIVPATESNYEKAAMKLAVYFALTDKEFELNNLLGTTGIGDLITNDNNAKSVNDLLEPVKEMKNLDDEDALFNLHTFQNMVSSAAQLQDPTQVPAALLAAARAMRTEAEAEAPGGSLYEALKLFVAKINEMKANRTLADNFATLKKELSDLSQNILLIDEHAAANKAQHDLMNEGIADLLEKLDEADKVVEAMPESAAKTNAKQTLNNIRNSKTGVAGFQATVDKDYEEGGAWRDGSTTPETTKLDEDAKLAGLQAMVDGAIARATGADPNPMIADNNTAYGTFQNDYEDATQEFYVLVEKLEQLKNLKKFDNNSITTLEGTAASVAEAANNFLFGKVGTNPDATETAKDKLDRIYAEGTQARTACNEARPVQPWPDSYSDDLNEVKTKLEQHITAVDNFIKQALDCWVTENYAKSVYEAAEKNFNFNKGDQFINYWDEFVAVENLPHGDKATEAQNNAYNDAYKAAVLAIITDNTDYNNLYTAASAIDAVKKAILSADNQLKIGSFSCLGLALDVNNLFDNLFYMWNNFAKVLTSGQDAEAAEDAAIYTTYASEHLAADYQWLVDNEFPTDELIDGAAYKMDDLIDEYEGIVLDKDGNDVEMTNANHSKVIQDITAIVGTIDRLKDEAGKYTGAIEWKIDGKCAFVHNLMENADPVNVDAVLATIEDFEEALQEVEEYIKNYQTAPKFAERLQTLKDRVAKTKAIATSEDAQRTAISINKELEFAENALGTVTTLESGNKKLEDYEDVLGTMDAESGDLPALVQSAFNAEKAHLQADINEMRAEFKQLAADAQGDYNDKIEALWAKVEAAKNDPKFTKTKINNAEKKDFNGWDRTDLVALQNEVKALYKELRTATGNAIDAAALVADLTSRLEAVSAAAVEDAYAAEAPTVKKFQSDLNTLVANATAAIAAAQQSGDVDYNREKLEAMVQNAENKLAARDADVAKVVKMKENADKLLAKLATTVADSKAKVNKWLEDAKGIEAYDLASNEESAPFYEEADELVATITELKNAAIDGYDYVASGSGYAYVEPAKGSEEAKLEGKLQTAIQNAEDEAVRFDIGDRLAELTAILNMLQNKVDNNLYPGFDAFGFRMQITSLRNQIANVTSSLEPAKQNFANQLAKVETYKKNADGEYELSGGIRYDIENLVEGMATNVKGDMDGDGKVTLGDARYIAQIAMGYIEMPAYGSDEFTSADVNSDNKIDLADAACAVNIYFYGNPNGPEEDEARVATNIQESASVESMKLANGLTRLAINLDNAQQYAAFQMDVQLPAGMKLAAASLGERAEKQYLMTNEIDGVLRVGAMSVKNEAFNGNSGAVLYLDFEVAEGTDDFVRFDNVIFVNKKAQAVQFNLGGITPTGIQSANAETALGQKFYDLGGRMKSSLKKGVNVILDAAGNAKKVLTK